MVRRLVLPVFAFFCLGLLLAGTPAALAEEGPPAPAEEQQLQVASDEEAEEALALFKEEFKARGLTGDDKISQRDWAMSRLAVVQHPDVVEALAKVTRNREPILRLLAVIYLGEQRLFPALAGEHIIRAMKRDSKNTVLVMSALQALGELRYLGAQEDIEPLLQHNDYAIRKSAILAVGAIGDIRMLEDILKLVGIEYQGVQAATASGNQEGGAGEGSGSPEGGTTGETEGDSGGKEVVEEGYSWEGAEATVDYGDADNTVREIPEAKAKAEAQIAENKREAEAAARSSGDTGGSVTGGSTGGSAAGSSPAGSSAPRGGASRTPSELMPAILKTLYRLTGERFTGPGEVRRFLQINAAKIAEVQARLEDAEKQQREAARNR
ncbi:MAG: HEAT repeat domain-containing protein [Planctomycetota bacterium]|jgi:hypothetical protein